MQAGQSKKNKAQYWWGPGRQHRQHILFCKTSEGLLLHVPQEHLLLAIQKEKSVILKKWPTIEGKRKRRIKKEKEKDLPLETPKESVMLVLSEPKRRKINPQEEEEEADSPSLPELPLEVQLQIIMFSSKPSLSVRKLILNIVKPNAEITVFSTELAKPKLVWAWYAIVLAREPPKNLAQLWNYYVQEMGDPNAFVRKWYSGFVREYDVSRVLHIYKTSDLKALGARMKGVQVHLIIEALQGRTIGMAKTDSSGVNDYQAMELIIAQVRTQLNSDRKFAKFFKKAVRHAMLFYGEKNFHDVFMKTYEERHKDLISWRYEKWTGGEKRTKVRTSAYPDFLRSGTAKWIRDFLNPILISSWRVARTIRGSAPTDVFSDMEYASVVWLIGVTLELVKQKPLSTALDGRWSTVHYREKFLDKLQQITFKATASGRWVIHKYDEEKRIRELKMDHAESVWILAGGRRELESDEREKEAAYEKENLVIFSANIDLVPGNDKIPFNMFDSVTTYIANIMGYEDEELIDSPTISEIMKAFVQDGLKKNYSKDAIKEKILYIIKRFMKSDGGWHGLSSKDFAKVEKDASAKIDLAWSMLVGKEKVVEIEEEEESEEDDDGEREFQKKRAAQDREYARLRRRDKELANKYDPKQKAALQAYKTAVRTAEQFITAEIKKKSESISNLKEFERKMNDFSSELQVFLVTKFKLGDLWNAAKKLGITKKNLGTAPRAVHSNGIAAIQQSIKKKKADAEGEMSSSSSTTITGKIGERYMHAIVTVDGSFVAAKIIGTSQDSLFRLAKNHVKNNGLGWDIKKPRSWFFNKNNPMGPHITLRKNMRKYVGEILQVKILNISHFEDPPSRWVVMNVELLPEKFKCLYECHISIGQQRKSTQFWN